MSATLLPPPSTSSLESRTRWRDRGTGKRAVPACPRVLGPAFPGSGHQAGSRGAAGEGFLAERSVRGRLRGLQSSSCLGRRRRAVGVAESSPGEGGSIPSAVTVTQAWVTVQGGADPSRSFDQG